MQAPETAAAPGRLADNILLFCRTLRSAGVPLGPGQVIDALKATMLTGLVSRDDLYFALRGVLIRDRAHFELFRQAFHVYFRDPRILERAMSLLLPDIREHEKILPPDSALRRLLEALDAPRNDPAGDEDVDMDRQDSWSRQEVLQHKDFEQMSLSEVAEAKEILRREIAPLRKIPTRRYRADAFGHRYDLRRSMQSMTRMNGQLLALARKRRRKQQPSIVLICDISGSMSAYSRLFLHFAHALRSANPRVHAFVFGTRLTNITRHLAGYDADEALSRAARDVSDWDGGTRISTCLERFNLDWNRRVLAQNAVVVLLTDGLERASIAGLERQMQRLRRSCRQLIWLNPVLRYEAFQPLAQGIRTMLPHVDRFLPAHNLRSLRHLCEILDSADVAGMRHEVGAWPVRRMALQA